MLTEDQIKEAINKAAAAHEAALKRIREKHSELRSLMIMAAISKVIHNIACISVTAKFEPVEFDTFIEELTHELHNAVKDAHEIVGQQD